MATWGEVWRRTAPPWLLVVVGLGGAIWRAIVRWSEIEFFAEKAGWIEQQAAGLENPAVSELVTGPAPWLVLLVFGLWWLGTVIDEPRRRNDKGAYARVIAGIVALSAAFYAGRAFPLDSWYLEFVPSISHHEIDDKGIHFMIDGSKLIRFSAKNNLIMACRGGDNSVPIELDGSLQHTKPHRIVNSVMPITLLWNSALATVVRASGTIECRTALTPKNQPILYGPDGSEQSQHDVLTFGTGFSEDVKRCHYERF
jgi:hypothetical protein